MHHAHLAPGGGHPSKGNNTFGGGCLGPQECVHILWGGASDPQQFVHILGGGVGRSFRRAPSPPREQGAHDQGIRR